MDVCLTIARCIECCLDKMLLYWFARTLFVGVECHKTLGLCTVSKTVDDDVANDLLVINLWLEELC